MSETAAPRLRADAQRNRDHLVAVARDAFAAPDAGPAVTLDAIAKRAGVGIGTLYRHFPTREALVEAVYRSELDEVCDAAPRLLDTEATAADALHAWILRYARFVGAKHGMADSLRAVFGTGAIEPGSTRARIVAALDLLLRAGERDGSLRAGSRPDDVASTLVGVFLATGTGLSPSPASHRGDEGQVGRMLELVFAGLRA
jgi:AcrR family transcriptional regulator